MNNKEYDGLKRRDDPLCKIDYILKAFAQQYNKTVQTSFHQDCPSRSITFSNKSTRNFLIRKSIYLKLIDWHGPFKYEMVIIISNWYGIREFIVYFLPFLNKFMQLRHIRIEKKITDFEKIIEQNKLRNALEDAKKIIDNFNDNEL